MPPPHVGGCDDGEFTYDGHDGMVRDVRNYTFNHLSIPSLLTMPLGTRPWLISSNKYVIPPTVTLGLALLDHLRLSTVRLSLPAMRLG